MPVALLLNGEHQVANALAAAAAARYAGLSLTEIADGLGSAQILPCPLQPRSERLHHGISGLQARGDLGLALDRSFDRGHGLPGLRFNAQTFREVAAGVFHCQAAQA